MKIVENGKGIHFDPIKHCYTNSKGEQYVSATSFIKKFSPPFDSDFWSKYKAVERLLYNDNRTDDWKRLKMKYLRSDSKELFDALSLEMIGIEALENMQETILKEWKQKSDDSLAKGSAFHDKQEMKYRRKYNYTHDWNDIDLVNPNLDKGIYPELRLYNHDYCIAGSADKIKVYKSGKVDIHDYKTSKSIDFTSWKNPWSNRQEMMLDPLSDLPNCNYIHYTLQLSLYAWMLEQLGYTPNKLIIQHIIPVEKNGRIVNHRKHYPVDYLKGAIELMLEHHKQQSRYEKLEF